MNIDLSAGFLAFWFGFVMSAVLITKTLRTLLVWIGLVD